MEQAESPPPRNAAYEFQPHERPLTLGSPANPQNRFQAGYSPYLEVVDAQRALLAVDPNLVQIEADQLDARVSLYQAMGGGWRAEGPAP